MGHDHNPLSVRLYVGNYASQRIRIGVMVIGPPIEERSHQLNSCSLLQIRLPDDLNYN